MSDGYSAPACMTPATNFAKMKRNLLTVLVVLGLLHSLNAIAEKSYRLTGVAKIYKTEALEEPNLELPVNPAISAVITMRDDSFSLNYDGASSEGCAVHINKRYPFSFSSAPLGTYEKLNKFLQAKFHVGPDDWSTMYLLGDAASASCTSLQFAKIYDAESKLFLLNGPYLYMFERELRPFKDANKSLDCLKARTNVENLICRDPRLVKMDGSVNYGFVLMQTRYSKETSYEDPVRIEQMKWISQVRNRCTTTDCLLKEYTSRIKYIQTKVSSTYPSYPEEEEF